MKNKLIDLNNHLFMQLERLGDEGLKKEALEKEVQRAEAIIKVSEQIISNANLSLRAVALVAEYGGRYQELLPGMIEGDVEEIGRRNPGLTIQDKSRRTA